VAIILGKQTNKILAQHKFLGIILKHTSDVPFCLFCWATQNLFLTGRCWVTIFSLRAYTRACSRHFLEQNETEFWSPLKLELFWPLIDENIGGWLPKFHEMVLQSIGLPVW